MRLETLLLNALSKHESTSPGAVAFLAHKHMSLL